MNKLFVSLLALAIVAGVVGFGFIGSADAKRASPLQENKAASCTFYIEVFGGSTNPLGLSSSKISECQYKCPPKPTGACTKDLCVDPSLSNEWACIFPCVGGAYGAGAKCPTSMCTSTNKC